MITNETSTREIAARAEGRSDLWIQLLRAGNVKAVAEVGVYRGDFAAALLGGCDTIETYYMIDPWRHLDDWNKPANRDDASFEAFLVETKLKTDFAADKRVILRGTTTEVIDQIPDGSLDFAYVDGDHTLRGISIDLIRVFPKLRDGGGIGGDDFVPSMWQHHTRFEPSLVFPFAVHFAEAVGARIFALPRSQFLIEKDSARGFEFVDLTGEYRDTSLGDQLHPDRLLRLRTSEMLSPVRRLTRRAIVTAPRAVLIHTLGRIFTY
jgi:methyltransferase family protein